MKSPLLALLVAGLASCAGPPPVQLPTQESPPEPPAQKISDKECQKRLRNLASDIPSISPDVLQDLVERGCDIGTPLDDIGQSLLHIAAREGSHDAVSDLLASGAKVHALNIYLETPLHIAVENSHSHLIELLVDSGADIWAEDNDGKTPFHRATSLNVPWKKACDSIEILAQKAGSSWKLKYFIGEISKCRKLRAEQKYSKTTDLHVAVENGDLKTVKELVGSGSDLEARDHKGRTPLLAAVDGKNMVVARFLIENGADIKAQDAEGRSVLFKAIDRLALESIRYLISAGADVTVKDKDGISPIQHLFSTYEDGGWEWAAYTKLDLGKAAELLISKGAAASELIGHFGINELLVAALTCDMQKVESLSKDGDLVDNVDDEYRNALDYAAMSGCSDAVDVLVQYTDVDTWMMARAAFNGHTVLAISLYEALKDDDHDYEQAAALLCGLAANGDLEGVKKVLKQTLDIKEMFAFLEEELYYQPPVIHHAAAGGNLSLVKYLVKKGFYLDLEVCSCSPYVCDTAFTSAVRYGRLDVAKYLRVKGVSFYKYVCEHDMCSNVHYHIDLANRSGSPEMLEFLLKLKTKYKMKYKKTCTW